MHATASHLLDQMSGQSQSPTTRLRKILFKNKKEGLTSPEDGAAGDRRSSPKARTQTFDKTRGQLKKIVMAQKTALGQVQVSTILVKEEDDDIEETVASKVQLNEPSKAGPDGSMHGSKMDK